MAKSRPEKPAEQRVLPMKLKLGTPSPTRSAHDGSRAFPQSRGRVSFGGISMSNIFPQVLQ
jgi:hypothetical protein